MKISLKNASWSKLNQIMKDSDSSLKQKIEKITNGISLEVGYSPYFSEEHGFLFRNIKWNLKRNDSNFSERISKNVVKELEAQKLVS